MHSRLMNVVMIALLALAALELGYTLVTRKAVHSFRDTVSSISLGIGQQALNVYLAASFLAVYALVHAKFAVAHLTPGVWWHWAVVVFACDFAYYCGHRTAHTVNLFIAGHIVHHQAEDFNLLSSLRQSWTAWIQMFPFFLPLAAIGVPLEMFVYGQMGIMLFQYLSHTGALDLRLGVLDRVFITPRNHRVHHGATHPYWGANCGGMFVIWDRVFGSFVEEDPRYPLRTGAGIKHNFYDPFEANLEYYRRIWFVSARRRGLREKLRIWFQSPKVLSAELTRLGYRERRIPRDVNRAPIAPREKAWIVAALVVTLALFGVHRAAYERFPAALNAATGIGVFGALWLLGAMLSGAFRARLPAPPQLAFAGLPSTVDSATSAPGTYSESRTSPTPPARTSDGGAENPEAPSSLLRAEAPCAPGRETPRTPCTERSESPSPGSGRSSSLRGAEHEA